MSIRRGFGLAGDGVNWLRYWQRGEQKAARNSRGIYNFHGLAARISADNDLVSVPTVQALMEDILYARVASLSSHYTMSFGAQGGTGTFGNDAMLTAVGNGTTGDIPSFLSATGTRGGASGTKVCLLATSMGFVNAVNWALRNPTKVNGIIGLNPVISLAYHYNAGVAEPPRSPPSLLTYAFPDQIDAAYGFAPGTTAIPAGTLNTRDPLTLSNGGTLGITCVSSGIPFLLLSPTDDSVTGVAQGQTFIQQFCSSFPLGKAAYQIQGSGGDHFATWATLDTVLPFLDALSWT